MATRITNIRHTPRNLLELLAKEEEAKKKLDASVGDETVLYMEIMDKEIYACPRLKEKDRALMKASGQY